VSWTGGQYSLFRAAFALYLFVHFLHLVPYAGELFSNQGVIAEASDSPLIGLFPNVLAFATPALAAAFVLFGAALAIPFGIGFHDRIAAVLLWYVWACLLGRAPLIANPGIPYVGWMLLAHAFIPGAPYGSWRARGRLDPGGDWRMPPLIFAAAWFLMAAGYSFSGVTKLVSPSWIDGTALLRVLESPLARPTFLREMMLSLPQVVLQLLAWSLLTFEVLFLPLALIRKLRPLLWCGMLAMHFGILAFVAFADLTLGMVMLHLFTFSPAWVTPLHAGKTEHLFYDGFCGLCHRTVRMVLAEDVNGAFRLAALQSDTFARLVPEEKRAALPDTVVVLRDDGLLLTKSAGIIYILLRLGRLWRVAGAVLGRIPSSLLDRAYDFIARIRHRLFAKPTAACPIVPRHLAARFDP
jgi:predicted DCC family thiol-disulfide oxidoreductase YuxK